MLVLSSLGEKMLFQALWMSGPSSPGSSAAGSVFGEARCPASEAVEGCSSSDSGAQPLAAPRPHCSEAGARREQWGSFIEATFAIIYQLNTNMQHCIPVTNEAEGQVPSQKHSCLLQEPGVRCLKS